MKYILILLLGYQKGLRFHHEWISWGHPKEDIISWGTVTEGALCKCGVRFYLWDL